MRTGAGSSCPPPRSYLPVIITAIRPSNTVPCFSDFAHPLRDRFAVPGAEPEFLVNDTGQIF